jgi:hypothetical protein
VGVEEGGHSVFLLSRFRGILFNVFKGFGFWGYCVWAAFRWTVT